MLEEKYKNLLRKTEKIIKENKLDLSADEDLSIAIMNLVSIEEHLFFTGAKTQKEKYFDLLQEVREMRKELLKKIIKDYEGEVWCLPPESYVFANPAPVTIKEVSIGQKILTADGDFHSVDQVFKRRYEGEMVSIFPYYSDVLDITPNHSVLCVTGVRKKQKDVWRKNFKKPKVVWKSAKDLEETDFLVFPRYKKEEDRKEMELTYEWENKGCFKKKGIDRPTRFRQSLKIKVSKFLMELIGFYLSEGSVSERKYYYKGHKKHSFNLYFSFGKKEEKLINRVKNDFQKVFGFSPKLSETHTTIDIVCSQRTIVKFFSQFGRKCNEKQLPLWVINLPREKLLSLVWAMIKGDGCESKYNISYFTISNKLAYQLRLILFKLGVIHSLHLRKKEKIKGGEIKGRKIIARHDGFSISISGDAARLLQKKVSLKYSNQKTSGNFGYVLDDFVMLPIKKIERKKYSGMVYNLSIPFEENYVTFAGVVHNCISKHLLATSMRLIEVGTKKLNQGDKKEAKDLFSKAYDLYSLFWGLNLKMVNIGDVKKVDDNQLSIHDKEKSPLLTKINKIIQKIIDCCKE